MERYRVHKFGGSCVADAACMRRVAQILDDDPSLLHPQPAAEFEEQARSRGVHALLRDGDYVEVTRRPRRLALPRRPWAALRSVGLRVAIALAMPQPLAAQALQTATVTVGRPVGDARPIIDGRVDDDVWGSAEPFAAFIQQEPIEGAPATERTEIRFLADDRTLYVAVVCFDPEPASVVVRQSRRDADPDDTDSVRILLDTFHDGQNAFVFGTNPFGIEYDGQVRAEGQTGQIGGGGGGGGINVNWDGDWTVRALITDRGWEAEFAIPLKTLRYNPGSAAPGASMPSATSGARTSRCSCRRCRGATVSSASPWPRRSRGSTCRRAVI